MKSFCASALVFLASLGWAVSQAAAQAGAYDSTGAAASGFNLPVGRMSPYGSMFASSTPSADPNPESGEVIDGAVGPSDFQQAVQAEWTECDACRESCGAWYATLGGLAMGRSRPNAYWTTYSVSIDDLVLNTQNAGANWAGGWQASVGYMFGGCECGRGGGCGPYGPLGSGWTTGPGIGFTYWGLGNMGGFAQVDSPTDSLNATFSLLDPSTGSGQVEIGGQPFSDFFDSSASHRISRDDSASNYELNLFFGTFNHYRWTLVPFVGFRVFRFDERLGFSGLAGGGTWGGNGGVDQADFSFRTMNEMYGLQLGTYATYQVFDRFSWFVGPKLGLFGNQMSNRALLVRGDGVVAYDITAQKSDFSLLGEIDTGFSWAVGPHFMAYLGYRVLGVTNVALADNQFVQGIGDVKQSGSLILHGIMMGGGWTF